MAGTLAKDIFEGGPSQAPPKKFGYGTAGFRDKAELLDVVMFRVGVLAALRARHTGKIVGVMVTASHNGGADNGAKIVDPDGGMLASDWENLAAELANCGDVASVESVLSHISLPDSDTPGLVVLGRDTRVSSPHLATLVASGVATVRGEVHDLGIVTTPQVHWAVLRANQQVPAVIPALTSYYDEHVAALHAVFAAGNSARISVTVDCANGVGAKSLLAMQAALKAKRIPLDLTAFNAGGLEQGDNNADAEFLNAGCGAEFVQKTKDVPRAYAAALAAAGGASAGGIEGQLWASFDGDADRVVLFFSEPSAFGLIDGDKMACLLANFIAKMLVASSLSLSLGVVQTAYANGASTSYLSKKLSETGSSVKWQVACAATGVKYLHHRALEYDIGVYFEANGHGTVLFSPAARSIIAKTAAAERQAGGGVGGEALGPAQKLECLSKLINPAIGDALSDLLAVVAVMYLENISLPDFAAMYQDLPSRMTKVIVKDRTQVKTSADETQVLEPASLQAAIDHLVSSVDAGRCFVRPSGTEDCVRVYAEGASQSLADALANDVGLQVEKLLN